MATWAGLVKPDIVFFGEALPARFFSCLQADFPQCDLLLVLGTSLAVMPFAALIAQVLPGTPRLLINRERVGAGRQLGGPTGPSGPFVFDEVPGGVNRDGFCQGDCDDLCAELARLLGWQDEFDALCASVAAAIDEPHDGPPTTTSGGASGGASLASSSPRERAVADDDVEPLPPQGFTWGLTI